jgi:osmotically-inducible protein OsmY
MALTFGMLSFGAPPAEALPNPFDDRSRAVQNEDDRIFGDIYTALKKKKDPLPEEVNVDVWEGRVLLTGIVDDPKNGKFAVSAVRKVTGVKAVYSHIQNSPEKTVKMRKVDKSGQEAKEVFSDDALIIKIKTRMFSEKASVKSANYRLRVVAGHTYVIGFARDANEKKDILQVIRKTPGVKAMTQYITVMKKKK